MRHAPEHAVAGVGPGAPLHRPDLRRHRPQVRRAALPLQHHHLTAAEVVEGVGDHHVTARAAVDEVGGVVAAHHDAIVARPGVHAVASVAGPDAVASARGADDVVTRPRAHVVAVGGAHDDLGPRGAIHPQVVGRIGHAHNARACRLGHGGRHSAEEHGDGGEEDPGSHWPLKG